MLNKKAFQEMRTAMEQFDKQREQLIIASRTLLKTSKKAIYSAHRNELTQAKKLLDQAKTSITKMNSLIKKSTNLATVGAYMDALEEYSEARCYVHYLKNKQIPTPKQVGVPPTIYLASLGDVVGELVRKAINSAAKGDYETALEIKEAVERIHAELMLFNWRNIPARKKFDSIKYGLEKLEDLALKITFKQ